MKKYQIIYADPPWSYRVWSKNGNKRSACQHYQVMDKKTIQNLPIQKISDNNCVLFLWVTPPCLEEGLELIKKWGFIYKTKAFTWVKRNKKANSWFWGMGYYTRANSEDCLLAIKGKPLKRVSRAVHQIIDDKIRNHSQKPDSVRKKIIQLFGDLPRIELFAREKTEGWTSIGNGINGKDIKQELEEIINESKE